MYFYRNPLARRAIEPDRRDQKRPGAVEASGLFMQIFVHKQVKKSQSTDVDNCRARTAVAQSRQRKSADIPERIRSHENVKRRVERVPS